MAATTSNLTPRRNGFDFAALAASAGPKDGGDEVARLRAALETLSELVVAHGVMDARTLASLLGDLVQPAALSAPLPPPAPSAAEARLKPAPQKVAPKPAAAPVARKPAPAPVAAPVVVAPAPVVVAPAPVVVAPAPVVVAPAPAVVAPAPVVAAPAPVASTFVATPAPAPVAAAPAPKPEKKNPFAAPTIDAAQLAAELTETPPPALKPQGFFARMFGKKKTSPAAVAAAAESIEFTERTPKLPADTLYAEQQRATELSFPPPSSVKKPRPVAAKGKKSPRPVEAAPARFCDRCWRRMDASGTCKTCTASA